MATGDLIYLLAIFDRAAANLERLQAVWDKASPLLPSDAQLGSDPRHEDLARKWDDLLSGIPPIDGFGINESLPDFEGIGQSFLDYREIGELPTSVWREVERPGRLSTSTDTGFGAHGRASFGIACSSCVTRSIEPFRVWSGTSTPRAWITWTTLRAESIEDAFSELETLVGDAATRRSRWGDFARHLRFGQGQDWHDILNLDWPSVRAELEDAMYGEDEPLPIDEGIDLGQLAASHPTGSVSTEFAWSDLTSGPVRATALRPFSPVARLRERATPHARERARSRA